MQSTMVRMAWLQRVIEMVMYPQPGTPGREMLLCKQFKIQTYEVVDLPLQKA